MEAWCILAIFQKASGWQAVSLKYCLGILYHIANIDIVLYRENDKKSNLYQAVELARLTDQIG